MKEHHVVPAHNGGWNIKKSGTERISVHTSTKAEAIKKGRAISKNQGTEFVIHNKDGKIASKDSHGNDSFPPRG